MIDSSAFLMGLIEKLLNWVKHHNITNVGILINLFPSIKPENLSFYPLNITLPELFVSMGLLHYFLYSICVAYFNFSYFYAPDLVVRVEIGVIQWSHMSPA